MTRTEKVVIVVFVVVLGLMLGAIGDYIWGGESGFEGETSSDTAVRRYMEEECGYAEDSTTFLDAEWTTFQGRDYYSRWFEQDGEPAAVTVSPGEQSRIPQAVECGGQW